MSLQDITPQLGQTFDHPLVSFRELERNFDLIVSAVRAGERCPQSAPHGPINHKALAILCARGRVMVEIFPCNFRRVTVLIGSHKGKMTSSPTNTAWRPYRVIDAAGTRTITQLSNRQMPSPPRPYDPAIFARIK